MFLFEYSQVGPLNLENCFGFRISKFEFGASFAKKKLAR